MKNKSNHVPHILKDGITDTLFEFVTLDGRSIETINKPSCTNLFRCFLAVDRIPFESSAIRASDFITKQILDEKYKLALNINYIKQQKQCH